MDENGSGDEAPQGLLASTERQGMSVRDRLLGRDSYGVVLVMILASLLIIGVAGDSSVAHVFGVAATGLTMLYTFRTSGVRPRTLRLAAALVVAAVVATGLGALSGHTTGKALTGALTGLLVVGMPLAIVKRLRLRTVVDGPVVFGALCIYLMIGMIYSSVYSFLGAVDHGQFFVQTNSASAIDYIYFSFVTQTTVGYGDFTARADLGRILAVSEALMGQIYLVTVVAVLVSNLGRPRRPRPPRASRGGSKGQPGEA
jgi:hypothetical protein